MAESSSVRHHLVHHLSLSVVPVVVGQQRFGGAHRVEAVDHIHPSRELVGETVVLRPLRPQIVLDLGQPQRRAQRDQHVDILRVRHPFQAVVGDHRPQAVSDHDVRPTVDVGEVADEPLPHLVADLEAGSRPGVNGWC